VLAAGRVRVVLAAGRVRVVLAAGAGRARDEKFFVRVHVNLISSKIAKHVDVQHYSCLPALRLRQ